MSWKIPSLIPVFLFVVTLLPIPNLAQGQSIVLITFAVIGVGEGEVAEILWHSTPASRLPAPLPPTLDPQLVISIQAGGTQAAETVCKQTFQVPIPALPGLNALTLETKTVEDEKVLFVNGMEKESLSECFDNVTRLVYQIGAPRGHAEDGQNPVDPGEPRVGLPNIVSQAVYNSATGETVASSASLRLGYVLSQDGF